MIYIYNSHTLVYAFLRIFEESFIKNGSTRKLGPLCTTFVTGIFVSLLVGAVYIAASATKGFKNWDTFTTATMFTKSAITLYLAAPFGAFSFTIFKSLQRWFNRHFVSFTDNPIRYACWMYIFYPLISCGIGIAIGCIFTGAFVAHFVK